MLYESAKMIMMPICDSSVTAKPPLKINGITSISTTVTPQISQRNRFIWR